MEVLTETVRFRECVIDPQARTVLRNGVAQVFEPKVFGLVTYLIQHRDRVVTKEELLEQVWGRSVVVTDGVVARTVMKCRRLIGDDAREPTLIKTIHRIGYRFVAPLEWDPDSSGAARQNIVLPAGDDRVRVAMLPVLNGTGEAEYAWIDLGMMSCTVDCLREGHGFDVLSVGDVLAVVGPGDQGLALDVAAERLTRALQASHVVQASLTLGRDRQFVLRYRCIGGDASFASWQGSLAGADPVELSRRLAFEFRREISRSAAHDGDQPIGSGSFVLALKARALEALAGERWNAARRLLRVMLDLLPKDPWARREYGRCMAWLRAPDAQPFLEELLEDARREHDLRSNAEILHSLAILQQGLGRSSEAEQLLTRALAIAEEQHDLEGELPLLLSLVAVLSEVGSRAVAKWMLDRAALLAQVLGNQVASARVADLRGRVAMFQGDVVEAEREFRTAVAMCEDLGLHGPSAFSLAHLGSALWVQGRMQDAADNFERGFEQALESGSHAALGQLAIGLVYAGKLRVGDIDGAAQVTRRMRSVDETRQGLGIAYANLIEGILAARAARFDAALEALDRAEAGLPTPALRVLVLRQRIRMLVCLGLFADAESLCDELQSCAVGRVMEPLGGVVLHYRGLVAHASGTPRDALALLLESVAARRQLTLDGAEATFDAAWLCLVEGDVGQAHRLMEGLGELAIRAVDSDYPPALHTRGALHYAMGEHEDAARLQRRYCNLGKVVGRGDSGRLLAAYEAAEAGNPTPLLRIGMLPSMWDLVPALGRPQAYISLPANATAAMTL